VLVKKWILASLVGIIILFSAAYIGYRIYQRQQWNESYAEALDAFKRAYDYRDAGTLLFEPRWKDFEVAEDHLQRMSQIDYKTESEVSILRSCGDELQSYRGLGRTASDALANRYSHLVESTAASQREIERNISHCLADR